MKRLALFTALTMLTIGLSVQQSVNARRAPALTADLKEGKLELKSAGPLAFGPDGVLFVADTKAAAIVALATDDVKAAANTKPLKVEAVNQKIAALLGTTADQILIEDMAINPASQNAYLSVSRGRGPDAVAVLIRINNDGKLSALDLNKVKFATAALPDPPRDATVGEGQRASNPRRESITDIAYLDGRVFIAGLANEEFASTLRALPFPFKQAVGGTQVEIYHGAHGRFETRAPVRTFAPFKVGKEDHLLAAYTCTPLVQFPISALKPGAKLQGKTIAELGNRNRPLDMIVYQANGKHYLLMANSSRGVMKITTENIADAGSITAPVADKQGLNYETIAAWTNVDQLDRFDAKHATVVRRTESGSLNLETLPLP
jgi:hypothetical protein